MADFAEQFSVAAVAETAPDKPSPRKRARRKAPTTEPTDAEDAVAEAGPAPSTPAKAPKPKAAAKAKAAAKEPKPTADEEAAMKARIRLRVEAYTRRWPRKFEGHDMRLKESDSLAKHQAVDKEVEQLVGQGNSFELCKLMFQSGASGLEAVSARFPGQVGQLHAQNQQQIGIGAAFANSLQPDPHSGEASPMAEALEEFSIKYQHYFSQSAEAKLAVLFTQLAYSVHCHNSQPHIAPPPPMQDASEKAAAHADL